MTPRSGLIGALLRLFRPSLRASSPSAPAGARDQAGEARSGDEPGRSGETATVEIDPRKAGGVMLSYAPDRDGDPDAGEIVWTWVPYVERDGRGKDRPVLVIARQSADRVLAVKLTSRSHDGERDFLSIGSGPWDAQRRESWVDVDQLYSVHRDGMRREAAALDLERFTEVARALQVRYGWHAAG